jgi:hypothetical protein
MKLYTDLNEIPLSIFIEVYKGNYQSLVIHGNPDKKTITDTADMLISEYTIITIGKNALSGVYRKNENINLGIYIQLLETCVLYTKLDRFVDACNILKEIGYTLNPNDKNAIEQRINALLSLKSIQLDKIKHMQEENSGNVIDPDYFIKEIALVMTHFKMHINENEISAKKYAYMVKRMSDEIEATNRAIRKMKR